MDDDTRSKEDWLEENQKLKSQLEHLTDLQSQLDTSIQLSSQREKELHALMKGSKSILKKNGFIESARAIFDYCKDLIGATSGYVALLSETGEENEVLFLESGGLPCDVNPELPMPIRGLRADAYKYNKSVYHNDFMNSEWVEFMPKGHVILENVMFAPLIIEGKTVGIIGLANKAVDFNDNDAKMATGFGELAAIALVNSRNIDERKIVEKSLQIANDELEKKTSALEDMNTALKILLQKREQDNKELEENIFSNYEVMIMPFLNKLKNTVSDANQKNLIEIVDTNLNEIVSPFIKKLSDPMMNLTSTEIQISAMIKQGLSNKEIAQILVCSKRTIDSHRENIRKKLNLKNKKINLKTFLSNIQNT